MLPFIIHLHFYFIFSVLCGIPLSIDKAHLLIILYFHRTRLVLLKWRLLHFEVSAQNEFLNLKYIKQKKCN